ncbi:MAG: hypothetical protein M1826_000197 [Phylliscum demangeonii]|nr:MAG: hypothetical protein M1826_000197 [Phylliscum demangeonii]
MSAAGAPLTPPPDFVVLARAVSEVATQMSRLPPYVASNNLEGMFARLRAQVREDVRAEVQVGRSEVQACRAEVQVGRAEVQACRAEVQACRAEVQALRLEFKAELWNVAARSQNAWVRKPDALLVRLHNVASNAPIMPFPSTTAELALMSRKFDSLILLSRSSTWLIARMRILEAELGVVLRALELPVNGSHSEKRERLRAAAGLPTC